MCISGVADLLDDFPVEFRIFAGDHQLEGLARFAAQIVDQPAHSLKGLTDRDEAHGHGSPLELAGDSNELSEIPIEPLVAPSHELKILLNHRLHDGQLADEINEAVEFPRIDLDGRGTRAVNARPARGCFRRGPPVVSAGERLPAPDRP